MKDNEVYSISRLKCFCYRCGFIESRDIETIEKTWSDGEKTVVPRFKNERLLCSSCNKKSTVVLNIQNSGLALEFLLKNMHELKKANDSEAIKFLANVLDVG
jgi:hypothetical protein